MNSSKGRSAKRGRDRKEENGGLGAVEEFLIHRGRATEDIRLGKGLKDYLVGSHIIILICGLLFGAVLGTYAWTNEDAAAQVLYDAIKVPLLIFVTLYIALPVFYVFNLFTGGRLTIVQIAAVLFSSFSLMAFILLAFSPVLLLIIVTAVDYNSIVTFLVFACGFAGYCGLVFFFDGYRKIHDNRYWEASFIAGSLVLAFGGTQLSWVFRPYLHSGIFKEPKDNFYIAIDRLFSNAPDIAAAIFFVFAIIALVVVVTLFARRKRATETEAEVGTEKETTVGEKDFYPAAPPAIPLPAAGASKGVGVEIPGMAAAKPPLARCAACDSALELYDDGSGRCPQCGRQVWWDKSKKKTEDVHCPDCGKLVSPNWKFCPSCHHAFEEVGASCSSCGRLLMPDWRFCPSCRRLVRRGEALHCTNCGRVLLGDWSFCPSCNYPTKEGEDVNCPNCDRSLSPAWKYCPSCSTPAVGGDEARCSSCRKSLMPSWKFCPSCNEPTRKGETRCSNCDMLLSPNWNFCPACSNPVRKPEEKKEELKCGKCGKQTFSAWTYCPSCSTKLK